jgi:hypothetical protein
MPTYRCPLLDDVDILGHFPDQNGSAPGTDLRVGTQKTIDPGNWWRTLLRFDLSGLPAGITSADIRHAELSVFIFDLGSGTGSTGAGSGKWFYITPLAPSWVLEEVTYNIRSTGNSWTAAGGDFDATGAGTFRWAALLPVDFAVVSDVTALVQRSLDDARSTLEVVGIDDNEGEAAPSLHLIAMYNQRSTEASTARNAKLIVRTPHTGLLSSLE